jgi:hypothetical protein
MSERAHLEEFSDQPAAIGFRVKSGWAVAVLLEGPASAPIVLDRRRIELSDPATPQSYQPYHAGLDHAAAAAGVTERLAGIVALCARRSLATLLQCYGPAGRRIQGIGIVTGSAIDPASIANPHVRAHAAEGRLFRTVLEEAARGEGVSATTVLERELYPTLAQWLKLTPADLRRIVTDIGRPLGAPWGANEKAAAAGAWLAMKIKEMARRYSSSRMTPQAMRGPPETPERGGPVTP